MRVALYYAPALADPLWSAAAEWLGRDPETNAHPRQPDLPGIAEVTADARRYGFHATLKPPMRLRPGVAFAAVLDEAAQVAAGVPAFAMPALRLTELGGFLALTEATPSPPLQALADACVAGLDHLRAPPDDAELARRRRGGLSPAQDANLLRWGYPHVFATWFFHLTLTRRLAVSDLPSWRQAAHAHFHEAAATPRHVADICVFTQADEAAPFLLAERVPLSRG